MPAIEVYDLPHRAVLWPKSGVNFEGQDTVGAPVQIKCRWNTDRREVLDSKGNKIALDATAVVAQEVEIGSIMKLCTLDDIGTTVLDELFAVKAFCGSDDLKGRSTFRSLGLMHFRSTLPS